MLEVCSCMTPEDSQRTQCYCEGLAVRNAQSGGRRPRSRKVVFRTCKVPTIPFSNAVSPNIEARITAILFE